MAEGSLRRSQPTKPQQNLVEGQTTTDDGSTVFFRRPASIDASNITQPKVRRTKRLSPTDGNTQVMPKPPVDKVKQRTLDLFKEGREQFLRETQQIKGIQNRIEPQKPQQKASINQYTTYNAPNNTTIIMQQGGGQMPPQSPPPQMMASVPPPTMTPGPTAFDIAAKMNTVFFLNNLQTT